MHKDLPCENGISQTNMQPEVIQHSEMDSAKFCNPILHPILCKSGGGILHAFPKQSSLNVETGV